MLTTAAASSTRRNESNLSAWPSSYYGRTRRIDLAKLYSETLLRVRADKQQQQQHQRRTPLLARRKTVASAGTTRRKVSFATDPPVVHEYEPDDDDDDEGAEEQETKQKGRRFMQSCRRYDREGQLRIQTVDLRPIPNRAWCPALSLVDGQKDGYTKESTTRTTSAVPTVSVSAPVATRRPFRQPSPALARESIIRSDVMHSVVD